MTHTIWNEKYRPDNLENLIIESSQKQKFQEYIDNQNIPHIGFFGKTGSGKTTLAKILIKSIDCDFLYLNATEDRSMDTIKEKVGGFASTNSFKPLKIVVLDECLDENTLVTVIRKGNIEKIPIKDLNDKEDLVKSYNEDSKSIQWVPFSLYNKGFQDCYEIEFENGEIIICTESHKWYIEDDNNNPIVVTTKDILEKGYILTFSEI
jgi:replication factor C small subunit